MRNAARAASAGRRGSRRAVSGSASGARLRRAELEQRAPEVLDARPRSRRRRANTATIRSSCDAELRRLREQVDLVQHDHLPAARRGRRRTRRARGRSGATAPSRIAGRGVDHVDEQPRPLEVREELVAEARLPGGALDQAGNVRDGQLPAVRRVDRPEHRLERRERVVGDLRLRIRDPPQERRLAGVRQADERSVGDAASGAARARHPRPAGRSRQTAGSGASAVAKRRLPRPPAPPRQTTTRAPGCDEIGDECRRPRAPACRPARATRRPRRPRRACRSRARLPPRRLVLRFERSAERSRRSGSATSTTSPPRPPSPPSGPPLGTCFSRRKLSPPSPPRPAWIWIRARSWNIYSPEQYERDHPMTTSPIERSRSRRLVADDRDGAALAARPELDRAVLRGEDRVVAADARCPGPAGSGCRAGGR